MKDLKKYHIDTLAIHAGQEPDPTTGAIMTPVFQTSTYVQSSPGVYKGYDYSRADNPTRFALEQNLAALEGAAYGLSFASGCAAMNNAIMHLSAGDHVIVCDDVYGGTHRLFKQVMARAHYEFSFVNLTSLTNIEAALKPNTKMIWIETPSNPLLKIMDIAAITSFAKSKNILTLVDNTFASPILQRPLELGADIVMHSTTKYIGGHSDVIGGFLGMNRKDLFDSLKFLQKSIGGVPGPWDCFLTLRGTKTLPIRMERHCFNAKKIAAYLEKHKEVERVIYPGLESHPQYAIAKKQMKDFGGMLSFIVKGGLSKSKKVLETTKVFSLAESLGGVESLIEHPAIMTHASVAPEVRKELGINDGLIRLSVGIEHVDDLLEDLETALR